MKATVTRTLQAPQYAPITITLEKECTEETYNATMDWLADAVENKLRQRYPQYAGVLPLVNPVPVQKQKVPIRFAVDADTGNPIIKRSEPVIQVEKSKPINLIEEMDKCTTQQELGSYALLATSIKDEAFYNKKFKELQNTQ